jgi:hypothetical protein
VCCFGQTGTLPISTPFGTVTLTTVVIPAPSGASQTLITGFSGGAINNSSYSLMYGCWCKSGLIDPASGAVTVLPPNNSVNSSGPKIGWTPLSNPTGGNTNDYTINQYSSYGITSLTAVGLDGDLFADIAQTYSGWQQYGQFSFEIYVATSGYVWSLVAHEDVLIGATNIQYFQSSGGLTSAQGGTLISQGATTNADLSQLNSDLTTTNSDLAALQSGQTAQTAAITGQNSNQSSFWSSLFVPQMSTLTNMQTALAQYQNYGPFQLFAQFIAGLTSWQTGGTTAGVAPSYVMNFGQVNVGRVATTLSVDLSPYSAGIKFARGLMAGSLWFAAIVLAWKKKISKAL